MVSSDRQSVIAIAAIRIDMDRQRGREPDTPSLQYLDNLPNAVDDLLYRLFSRR
jgi:hypothetical protein